MSPLVLWTLTVRIFQRQAKKQQLHEKALRISSPEDRVYQQLVIESDGLCMETKFVSEFGRGIGARAEVRARKFVSPFNLEFEQP